MVDKKEKREFGSFMLRVLQCVFKTNKILAKAKTAWYNMENDTKGDRGQKKRESSKTFSLFFTLYSTACHSDPTDTGAPMTNKGCMILDFVSGLRLEKSPGKHKTVYKQNRCKKVRSTTTLFAAVDTCCRQSFALLAKLYHLDDAL